MWSEEIAEQPRSLTTNFMRRVGFLAFSLVLLTLDLWSAAIHHQSFSLAIVWVLPSAIFLALTGWHPAIGGTIVISIATLTALSPDNTINSSLMFLGIFAVAADWISRDWWISAVLALLVPQTTQLAASNQLVADSFGMVLGSSIAIVGGFLLRHFEYRVHLQEQRRAAAEEKRAAAEEKRATAEKERAAAEHERATAEEALKLAVQAQKEIRQDLAATLHDTLAADLVRIALSSHSLAAMINNSEVAETAQELEEASRATLRDLRTLITTTRSPQQDKAVTTASVIQTCQTMLSGRNIKLSPDFPETLDASCSDDLKKNIALIIQESAMNILKYGKDGSEASISIEVSGEGAIDLMIVNECATERIEDQGEIAGGFGLDSLAARITNTGGFLEANQKEDRWVLVAHLVEQVKEPM